jgi:hypothetical protein
MMMWRFDLLARRRRSALADLCGPEAPSVSADARAEYQEMLPEIAALGPELLNAALAGTYEYLAYAKALRRHGHPDEAIGAFFADSFRDLLAWLPLRLGRFVYRLAQGRIARRLRREAAASQRSADAGGWQFAFVEGERAGEYGMDIQSCAVCSLYTRHGARELVPYLCALDDVMSARLHMGLSRNGTRALGAERCDFRYATGASGKPLPPLHRLVVIRD